MSRATNSPPGIDCWDGETEGHEYWTLAFDSDRHLPSRQGHTYPNSIVIALKDECDLLIAQRTSLRRDLARLQHQLDLVREELKMYKYQTQKERRRT